MLRTKLKVLAVVGDGSTGVQDITCQSEGHIGNKLTFELLKSKVPYAIGDELVLTLQHASDLTAQDPAIVVFEEDAPDPASPATPPAPAA